MNRGRLWLFALAVLLADASEGAAQGASTTGNVVGVVRDETRVLPDAKIAIVNRDTSFTRNATSDTNGRFSVTSLPFGDYTLTVELAGFQTTKRELTLNVGEDLDVEVHLTPPLRENVEVSATIERPIGSAVITEERIAALPSNLRPFVGFSVLTPGVAPDQTPQQGASRTSGLTVSGQRGRSNNVMVDGLDNNDETVGSVRALFSQEAVREYQVISGTPSAEFGQASGGIVNVVTKSGSNVTSGNLFGFFRDTALNAKGYFERFTPEGSPIDLPKAPFSQWQAGATLGGPIGAASSFYFLSFEHADVQTSNFVAIDDQTAVPHPFIPGQFLGTTAGILAGAGFPVETGNVPYDVTLTQFLARVDRHRDGYILGARFSTAAEENENVEPFGGLVARSRAAALDSTDVTVAGSYLAVLSAQTTNELRGQVALRNQMVRALDPSCGECLDEAAGGPTLEVSGVAAVGRQRFTPTPRDNVRYQLVETISHSRGAHQLRAGVDVSYIHGLRQALPLHFGGRYIFNNLDPSPLVPAPVTSIQAVALGVPAAYVQGYGYSGAASSFAELSTFVQDTWRPANAVTVNVGVRYQTQFWPAASYSPAGYPGTYPFVSDRNNLAPRLAVSWRPWNSRSTSIDAGYGLYYDNIITSVFGITKYIDGVTGVRTLVLPPPGSLAAWQAPGHRLSEGQVPVPYASVAITIDPALKTPYAHHTTVGVNQQLPGRVALAAHVLYVRGFNQLGTVDYNPRVPALGPFRRPADVNGVPGTSASVLQYTSFGETWYKGLRLSVDKRWADSQISVAYTLSKAEDNSTDFQTAFLPQNNGTGRDPNDPDGLPIGFRPEDERGASLQDEGNRLVVSGWYLAPGGVQIAAIVGYSSGRPYNILAGTDLNGDGDGGSSPSDRPRRVPGDPSTSIARNAGLLPSRATTDIRVSRRFTVRGRLTVEPMVDVFNLFNRTNFIGVQNVFGPGRYPDQPLPTYGQFTQAAAPRQVQIGLKVGF
jgi:hypothetical protein